MNSGHGVQRIRNLVNQIIGIFKDDQDEDEMDNCKQPQQNRREYVALE